jgi:hypothetical protein
MKPGDKNMKRFALLLLMLTAGAAQAQDPASAVLGCMRANVPETVRVDDFQFAVSDRQGEARVLKGHLYFRHDKPGNGDPGFMHAMLRIDQPNEFKGASYLVKETDDYLRDGMFVYLPAVRRVRRVTGSAADASLLGTSFSYFDFKQFANAFGDLVASLEAPETIDGRMLNVLSFKTLPGAETRYSGVRVWVDQKSCVPLKAEFSEGNKVRKRLTGSADKLKQANAYWYLTEAQMEDLVDGTTTIVRMNKVTPGGELAARYFDATAFYLGN